MFHADLTIDADLMIEGKKVTNENELNDFFNAEHHFNCRIGERILSVEYSPKDRSAIICWANGFEETFYFISENKNDELLRPLERLGCYDEAIIKDIVLYFCETGERNLKYCWIAEEEIY